MGCSVTEYFPLQYMGEREMEKQKIEKIRQNKLSAYLYSYTQYIWSPSRCIQHLKKLAQMGAGKSVTECFVRKKEKGTNKITDKQYVAKSFIQ